MLLKTILLIALSFATTAMADQSALVWMENGNVQRVTQADVNASGKGILGYVHEQRLKDGLCYEGKDFEVINILVSGLNRHGNEMCDGTISVSGIGVITVGPCVLLDHQDDLYYLSAPVCK